MAASPRPTAVAAASGELEAGRGPSAPRPPTRRASRPPRASASWSTTRLPPLTNVPPPAPAVIFFVLARSRASSRRACRCSRSRAPAESSRSPSSVRAAFASVRCDRCFVSGDASQPSRARRHERVTRARLRAPSQRKRLVTDTCPAPVRTPPLCTSSPITASAANSTRPPSATAASDPRRRRPAPPVRRRPPPTPSTLRRRAAPTSC